MRWPLSGFDEGTVTSKRWAKLADAGGILSDDCGNCSISRRDAAHGICSVWGGGGGDGTSCGGARTYAVAERKPMTPLAPMPFPETSFALTLVLLLVAPVAIAGL